MPQPVGSGTAGVTSGRSTASTRSSRGGVRWPVVVGLSSGGGATRSSAVVAGAASICSIGATADDSGAAMCCVGTGGTGWGRGARTGLGAFGAGTVRGPRGSGASTVSVPVAARRSNTSGAAGGSAGGASTTAGEPVTASVGASSSKIVGPASMSSAGAGGRMSTSAETAAAPRGRSSSSGTKFSSKSGSWTVPLAGPPAGMGARWVAASDASPPSCSSRCASQRSNRSKVGSLAPPGVPVSIPGELRTRGGVTGRPPPTGPDVSGITRKASSRAVPAGLVIPGQPH